MLELLDHPSTFPMAWDVLGWNIQLYISQMLVKPPLPPHLDWVSAWIERGEAIDEVPALCGAGSVRAQLEELAQQRVRRHGHQLAPRRRGGGGHVLLELYIPVTKGELVQSALATIGSQPVAGDAGVPNRDKGAGKTQKAWYHTYRRQSNSEDGGCG